MYRVHLAVALHSRRFAAEPYIHENTLKHREKGATQLGEEQCKQRHVEQICAIKQEAKHANVKGRSLQNHRAKGGNHLRPSSWKYSTLAVTQTPKKPKHNKIMYIIT